MMQPEVKKFLYALVIVFFALGLIGAFLTVAQRAHLNTRPATSAILGGTATSSNSYEYHERGKYLDVVIVYPASVPLPDAAAQKAQQVMGRWLAEDLAGFRDDFIADSPTSEDIEILGLAEGTKYSHEVAYEAYRSDTTVSYRFDIYEYTLGAHGNFYYKTFTFDQQGNELKLSDLFVATSTNSHADWLKRVSSIASAEIQKQLITQVGADLSTDFFADGVAPEEENFANFVLDGDTIKFFFPPYQVAPYVAGTFEADIPLSQLKDVLK